MCDFEIVFIVKGSIEENKANTIIKELLGKIYNKVKNDMDKVFIRKKDLVWEINGEHTGYYCLVPYNSSQEVSSKLSKEIRSNKNVIKTVTVKF